MKDSPIDLSQARIIGGASAPPRAEKDKTHDLAVVTVKREAGDPLVCPELTTMIPVGMKQPAIAGMPPEIVMHTVTVACLEANCAKWSARRKACGAMRY